jgi:hypothetical protein
MKPQRAALYARVSTKDQDAQLQLEELRRLAEQRGWTVVKEYVDEGVSGSKASRPGLDLLMADARAGKLDVVAVWKLDRLGRSLQHLLRTLDDLSGWGVLFVSARDAGLDTTTASGQLMRFGRRCESYGTTRRREACCRPTYASRLVDMMKQKIPAALLDWTDEGAGFGLPLEQDWEQRLDSFVGSESLRVGEKWFLGSSSPKGPFSVVVEMVV